MPTRLEEVLRAGRAAETGPSWNAIAGRLTDILPGDKTNDPSSPGMQDALRVAGEIEERQAAQRERQRIADRIKRDEHEAQVREAARRRELAKEFQARGAEQDRWEKLRVEAYNSGKHDMKELVWNVQRPLFSKMHNRLNLMRENLVDVYEYLVKEEAKDEVGSNPLRAIRIIKIQDNILQIDELIHEVPRAIIFQHRGDHLLEIRLLLKSSLLRGREETIIRHRSPEKVGKTRGDLPVIQRSLLLAGRFDEIKEIR